MDKLQKLVDAAKVKECIRGTPLDLDHLSDEKIRVCSILMLHCCLNGPVGVNKDTTFPEGLKGSIKGLLGIPVSNNSWARTCAPFATWLKSAFPKTVAECQQVKMYKDLWPLHAVNPAK